jgi:Flp pilus assembly protein TadG
VIPSPNPTHSDPSLDHHTPDDGGRHDRGATLVLFAMLITVLVGSGALVIDIGQLYSERRQLQNGADAAAFAVVTSCVSTANCADYQNTAQEYANLNARDNISAVPQVCGLAPGIPTCPDPPTLPTGVRNWVRVSTRTQTASGGSEVPFILGPILDATRTGQTMNAKATVGYGPLGATSVIPLALSRCTFDPSWVRADGSLNFPSTDIRIGIHSGNTCAAGFPDGFDFMADTSNCSASKVSILNGVTVVGAGNEGTLPSCRAVVQALYAAGKPVIFPLYSSRTAPGSGSTYTLSGFAAFLLCGYAFEGTGSVTTCPTVCTGAQNEYRICGRYVPLSVTDGEWGTGDDYAVRLVKGIG